ncbi:bifunctional diaminohydroxyphosphoribosylaminopyrimidine deaminase/5-amino-6-(5-phosphoribosylamino)uracil reductase RibD [Croceitalea sp. P059]|uniref:bifunctional diaminohydroxyphosphoribosylaminopyrimidine deaminase/5-amino-6-(5-phosphoribosylamino)uracil reductase RibD n=1 Tax=Croceitalea sp. P059 TaxID=3075601 RepID=UPI002886E9C7|nr:bifunctional diaminohydroxyphosphoribosylaminopyrimidine deaminase/5-amino-6-(5-phosphoribosylamino)uracil reductase RibD [Croceitalea sp. P059]MDT0539993.1 bifunctional diaminohydroxyphosphoribosylaminopyrimidine deaminase/5-amino-6-(5-phosphoribosylamino)uracil reductase RibD [Croceitalea sp. P059]
MNIDEKYLLRCIQLAKNGLGSTAPNPMVGAVLVHNNEIIGEGYTSPYGGPHAEVNAINSVSDKSLLKSATLYVTLEPCSHFGLTPPCSDLIVSNTIPKVVIGLQDPHKKVAGKGIAKLRSAGCEVKIGVLENECREHHKRFLTFQERKRPYIILKWAESSDGFIAPEVLKRKNNPEPYWITNIHSRQLVHQWRSEEQAILVGTNTVKEDNPKLNVRDWQGNSPTRVIIDANLVLNSEHNIFDKSIKTIVVHHHKAKAKKQTKIIYEAIDFGENTISQLCSILYKHHITSLIVEGGKKTLQSFIDENIWDETRIFKGTKVFETGLKAPKIIGELTSSKKIINDTLTVIKND